MKHIFDKLEVDFNRYSILLKGADTEIMCVCADEMIEKNDYYEFFINGNLIVMLPVSMVEDIL